MAKEHLTVEEAFSLIEGSTSEEQVSVLECCRYDRGDTWAIARCLKEKGYDRIAGEWCRNLKRNMVCHPSSLYAGLAAWIAIETGDREFFSMFRGAAIREGTWKDTDAAHKAENKVANHFSPKIHEEACGPGEAPYFTLKDGVPVEGREEPDILERIILSEGCDTGAMRGLASVMRIGFDMESKKAAVGMYVAAGDHDLYLAMGIEKVCRNLFGDEAVGRIKRTSDKNRVCYPVERSRASVLYGMSREDREKMIERELYMFLEDPFNTYAEDAVIAFATGIFVEKDIDIAAEILRDYVYQEEGRRGITDLLATVNDRIMQQYE